MWLDYPFQSRQPIDPALRKALVAVGDKTLGSEVPNKDPFSAFRKIVARSANDDHVGAILDHNQVPGSKSAKLGLSGK